MLETIIRVGINFSTTEVIDINIISEMLQLRPSEAWKKGDIRPKDFCIREDATQEQRNEILSSQPLETVYRRHSNWSFDLDDDHSLDLNDSFEKLRFVLEDKIDDIMNVNKMFDITPSLVAIIEIASEEERPGLYLEQPFISFANKINANIVIDWYFMY